MDDVGQGRVWEELLADAPPQEVGVEDVHEGRVQDRLQPPFEHAVRVSGVQAQRRPAAS